MGETIYVLRLLQSMSVLAITAARVLGRIHRFFLAAATEHAEQRATIFFAQALLLVAVGRLLGE
jgi:hypothetical protein